MNATYFEATKILTITSRCCDLPSTMPIKRFVLRVPTNAHLSIFLRNYGFKITQRRWKKSGDVYMARLAEIEENTWHMLT